MRTSLAVAAVGTTAVLLAWWSLGTAPARPSGPPVARSDDPVTPSPVVAGEPRAASLQPPPDAGRTALGPARSDEPETETRGSTAPEPACVVEGAVRDVDGRAIPGAEVTLDPVFAASAGSESHETTSDRRGRYRLERVGRGTYRAYATAEGFLSGMSPLLVVEPPATPEGPSFTLGVAPVIEGAVVDDAGRPIEGAVVAGQADLDFGEGVISFGTATTTATDGRFALPLKHDVPHRLSVRSERHESHEDDHRTSRPPGARDVRIVLRPLVPVELVVVDDATSAPIEHFEVSVVRGARGRWHGDEELLAPGRDGRASLEADLGTDGCVVRAPGRRTERLIVTERLHTLRVLPAPELVGRLLSGGVPVPEPRIEAEPWSRSKLVRASMTEPPVRGVGDGDGRFRIALTGSGSYRVELHGVSGSSLILVPVRVPKRGALDLGDLELPAPAILEGRVAAAPDTPLAGFAIFVEDVAERALAFTDDAGRFRTELPPGTFYLRVERDGRYTGLRTRVELCPGERRSVELELPPSKRPCPVVVRVLDGGRPAAGLFIALESVRRGAFRLGPTDVHGFATRLVDPIGPARLVLRDGRALLLEADLEPLRLEEGARVDRVVEVETGGLELVWPVPAAGERDPVLGASVDGEVWARFERDGAASVEASLPAEWTSTEVRGRETVRVLTVARLAPGAFTVQLLLADDDAGGSRAWRAWTGRALVEAGGLATLRVGR